MRSPEDYDAAVGTAGPIRPDWGWMARDPASFWSGSNGLVIHVDLTQFLRTSIPLFCRPMLLLTCHETFSVLWMTIHFTILHGLETILLSAPQSRPSGVVALQAPQRTFAVLRLWRQRTGPFDDSVKAKFSPCAPD